MIARFVFIDPDLEIICSFVCLFHPFYKSLTLMFKSVVLLSCSRFLQILNSYTHRLLLCLFVSCLFQIRHLYVTSQSSQTESGQICHHCSSGPSGEEKRRGGPSGVCEPSGALLSRALQGQSSQGKPRLWRRGADGAGNAGSEQRRPGKPPEKTQERVHRRGVLIHTNQKMNICKFNNQV
jgi:hypothetical protein